MMRCAGKATCVPRWIRVRCNHQEVGNDDQ
nr:MAG TPA: hypothetical protein [Caudoviricetes sp.]